MDLQLLAKSLGRSVDDTVLCVHMVLVQMTARISNRKLKSTVKHRPKMTTIPWLRDQRVLCCAYFVKLELPNVTCVNEV